MIIRIKNFIINYKKRDSDFLFLIAIEIPELYRNLFARIISAVLWKTKDFLLEVGLDIKKIVLRHKIENKIIFVSLFFPIAPHRELVVHNKFKLIEEGTLPEITKVVIYDKTKDKKETPKD